jgi:excisionase family DNA binding protein
MGILPVMAVEKERAIERHYSGRDLAELLAVHPETIRRAAARGDLPSVRVGSERRYSVSAVKQWLDARRSAA